MNWLNKLYIHLYCNTVFTFHLAHISLQAIAKISYYSQEGRGSGSIEEFVSWGGGGHLIICAMRDNVTKEALDWNP